MRTSKELRNDLQQEIDETEERIQAILTKTEKEITRLLSEADERCHVIKRKAERISVQLREDAKTRINGINIRLQVLKYRLDKVVDEPISPAMAFLDECDAKAREEDSQ